MWKREWGERKRETGERKEEEAREDKEKGEKRDGEGGRERVMKTVHCQCLSNATPEKSTGPLHAHLNAAFTEVVAAAPGALTPPTPPQPWSHQCVPSLVADDGAELVHLHTSSVPNTPGSPPAEPCSRSAHRVYMQTTVAAG